MGRNGNQYDSELHDERLWHSIDLPVLWDGFLPMGRMAPQTSEENLSVDGIKEGGWILGDDSEAFRGMRYGI